MKPPPYFPTPIVVPSLKVYVRPALVGAVVIAGAAGMSRNAVMSFAPFTTLTAAPFGLTLVTPDATLTVTLAAAASIGARGKM